MDTIVMVAQIILSLSILVGLHEMGHLLAAKVFGMRVEQFSIGFPPKLFTFKYGETEYALSAIPLGGYVKISGMIDESLDTETMKAEPQPWEFRSKPAWQRLIVMLGGIFVNVITGMVIFICLTFFLGEKYINLESVNDNGGILALELAEEIGLQTGDKIIGVNGNDIEDFNEIISPNYLLDDNAFYTVIRNGNMVDVKIPGNMIERISDEKTSFVQWRIPPIVDSVYSDTYAEKMGLQKGDTILTLDGAEVKYFDQLRTALKNRSTDTVSLAVLRNKEVQQLEVAIPADSSTLGFTVSIENVDDMYLGLKEYSLGQSMKIGSTKAFDVVFTQIKAFGKMFSGDLNVTKNLSGPIGIAKAYGTEWDWQRFWYLTGLLSMVLAFMNLLPIPALDGGHVMFLTAEIISGRKPSDRFLENAQKVGMVILLTLMVFIFANDILKAFGLY